MTTTVPGAGSSRHTATAEDAARSQHLSRRPSLNAGAASDDDVAAATHGPNADTPGVAPRVIKAVSFFVGCALLVACAFALDRLGEWSADYGRVWVFLAFFLVMSLGGRWFWAGADAAIGWVKDQVRR